MIYYVVFNSSCCLGTYSKLCLDVNLVTVTHLPWFLSSDTFLQVYFVE